MEKIEDQTDLGDFICSQLRPFTIVVLVYAVLENWWIYYMPGNQFMSPYFCVFIYNLLLIWSNCLLCVKRTRSYDALNMFMTYFFLFAVEIFNTARKPVTKSPYGYRDFGVTDEPDTYKYTTVVRVVGFAFFIYAVHVRSRCLEFIRGGPVTKNSNESLWAFFTNSWSSETKISTAKRLRRPLCIFVSMVAYQTLFQLYLIVYTINTPKPIVASLIIAYNAVVALSNILFCFQRSIACNVFNMLVAYGLIIQNWLLGALIRLSQLRSLTEFINCGHYLSGGIFFFSIIIVRTFLLDDCYQLASARRLLTLFKKPRKKSTILPFDAETQPVKEKMTKYGTV